MGMVIEQVVSSNMKEVGYDQENKILSVRFQNGNLYHYKNVDGRTFDEFRLAESKGKYFFANIKGKFEFVKIVEDKE
jgi:hypothetical protein